MHSELFQQLTNLAFEKTIPFCYGCYVEAPTGRCDHCGSDDLMRLLPGVGCEYGTDWVVKELLREELEPVDVEQAFEDSVRECYPDAVQVAWITVDPIDTVKSLDPVSWRCALSDWESSEESEGNIITFDGGSTYYWRHDLEELLN